MILAVERAPGFRREERLDFDGDAVILGGDVADAHVAGAVEARTHGGHDLQEFALGHKAANRHVADDEHLEIVGEQRHQRGAVAADGRLPIVQNDRLIGRCGHGYSPDFITRDAEVAETSRSTTQVYDGRSIELKSMPLYPRRG